MNGFEEIEEHVIIQSRLISLNSRYATKKINGENLSSLLFDFNSISPKSVDTLYHTIAIQSAEIPASYYNVNGKNNIINISDNVGTTASITIPEGNYNANTFASEFITQFNAAAFAGNATLSYKEISGKYSLMSDTNSTNLTINLASTTCRLPLGIALDAVGTLVFNYAVGNATLLPLPADFLGVTKIKLLSDALAGGNFDSNNLNTTTLVDTISATATPFGLIIYNSLGRESFVKSKRIDEIDVQLLDQNNNLIDFNGINWTMTLLINTHRRQKFSKKDGTILNDKYVASLKALKKPESLKEELEDVNFDDDDDLLLNK
tara:strand:+ start:488 stop:1447 length:960 start_codon:yes stop_codon:yes gene_type:complete